MSSPDPSTEARQTCLPIMLTVLLASFFVMLLILVTGGWFMYLLLIGGGIGFVALFHYLTWGALMDREVADEREAEELRRKAEEQWQTPDSERYRRF